MIYVDDLFGLENYSALKVALQGSGITLVQETSYPGGVKDLSPVLRSIKDKNPDAFVGFTYPPDTILASKQAKEVGLNPKFFYASVGTAFQLYKNVMTPAGAEGVLGMGSWNSKTSPAAKAYFDAHTKKFGGKEPDRWASGACWAGMEITHRRGGEGRAGPQGHPRLHRQHHATRPSWATSSSRQREHRDAGHGEPVAERRVRGGVAAKVATAKLNASKPAWKQRQQLSLPGLTRHPACGRPSGSVERGMDPQVRHDSPLHALSAHVHLRLARTPRLRPHHRAASTRWSPWA